MAVHDRPAAFEGSDGFSYSVEIIAEQTDGPSEPWQAFFLFVKWARLGAQSPEGHLETGYLVSAPTEPEARARLGERPLGDVKAILDQLIAERGTGSVTRRWWDAMHDESGDA